jgi:hypothetical protein
MILLSRRYVVFFLLGFVFLFSYVFDCTGKEIPVPDTVNPGLNYLLSLAEPSHSRSLDMDLAAKAIEFVISSKEKNAHYTPANLTNITSAYLEFDIHQSLKHILELGFNPDIPPFFLSPSSIRLAYWTEVEGKKNQFPPRLSTKLDELDHPFMVAGVEHEEITPDVNTGAYYGYDLNRTLVLLKYQGRPVLISISRQKKISDIGKQGAVLGKDDNWDYFYSGKNGLTKPGLGWVNSYMYDSCAISIYVEQSGSRPMVHCGIYKWLRAGWADMNMVQSKHIYGGLLRYTNSVKEILECTSLPEPSKIAEMFSTIRTYSTEELRGKIRNYIGMLSQKYGNDNSNGGKLISETIKESDYLNRLNSDQMQSVLIVEYIKYLLGKNALKDVSYFISPT